MNNDLLTSLRKYRPREGKNPLENFITESFAWILKNYPEFSVFFIRELSRRMDYKGEIINPVWNTQVNFGGVFPDMVCEMGSDKEHKSAFIFENKAWSSLHYNQLENYRIKAQKKYLDHRVILLTSDTSQHLQKSDLAICWRDVYSYIDKWIKKDENINNPGTFILQNFLRLIEHEGMGPKAPVSHESILYYLHARNFLKETRQLVKNVYNKNLEFFKELIGADEIKYKHRDDWGRIGIEFFDPWLPGLFIGVISDWEDHRVKPMLGDNSPDFSIILSFNHSLHNTYHTDDDFLRLIEYLNEKINELSLDGWQVYNHFNDESVEEKNPWHPLHIRKPLLEVLRGTLDTDQQEKAFLKCAEEILPLIVESSYFRNMRLKFKETII